MDAPALFKKLNYSWKRFRRRLKKSAKPEELKEKIPKLKILFQLQQHQLIDLYFGDESGFSLTPSVPYGWQPIGIQWSFPTQKKHIQNTLGLLNVSNKHLVTYSTKPKQMVNTEFIIDSLDDFAQLINKPTVIVLDNAPWHTSKAFRKRINYWNQNDLYIFHLPRYCPHLNLIETLWRKIKYEWLRTKDYNSKTALKKRLDYIFANFGSLFDINFSMNFYS